MAYLSSRTEQGYCLLGEVSGSLELPRAFLAKVLQRLVSRGLLDSRRGARGGYRLARSSEAVSLADIVSAVGEPASGSGDCTIAAQDCQPRSPCLLHHPMARAEAYLWKTLERTRLKRFSGEIGRRVSRARLTKRNRPPEAQDGR